MFSTKGVKWLLLVLGCLLLATLVKVFLHQPLSQPIRGPKSSSAAEAKRDGIWLCDVAVAPREFGTGARKAEIVEAWIEGVWDRAYFLGWVPYWERQDLNFLVIRLRGGGLKNYSFAIHERDVGFFVSVDDPSRHWAWLKASDLGPFKSIARYYNEEIGKVDEVAEITLAQKR
jgi:hypothetical protein